VVTGPDGEEQDLQQQRCFELDFPGKAMGMRRLLRQNSVAGPVSWTGSLMQDNQDASGLMYRRNRFYDPKSGRFTQEDPIGLAGGVNSYGFAGGDPVNYADPYGLATDSTPREARKPTPVRQAEPILSRIRRAWDRLPHPVRVLIEHLPDWAEGNPTRAKDAEIEDLATPPTAEQPATGPTRTAGAGGKKGGRVRVGDREIEITWESACMMCALFLRTPLPSSAAGTVSPMIQMSPVLSF
jgi:RHS repeat-associated protein